jgi:hypothetical protein
MKTPKELINAFDDEEVLGWADRIESAIGNMDMDFDTEPINLALAYMMLSTKYLVKEVGLNNNTLSKMVTQGADKFRSKLM